MIWYNYLFEYLTRRFSYITHLEYVSFTPSRTFLTPFTMSFALGVTMSSKGIEYGIGMSMEVILSTGASS